MDIIIGSILQRKNRDTLFEVVSTDDLYTKIIRLDDYEHRMMKKKDLLANHIFHMMYKVIQKNILRRLDEPQYVYVETKKLNTYFVKK
jgi:hypothetical protein